MRIAVLDESRNGEPRVAATPETITKLKPLGATFVVEKGAGTSASISDAAFEAAGASIAKNAADALKDADVILCVRRPKGELAAKMKKGAILLGILDPYGNAEALQPFADKGIATFAMELMPRITRAQVMDVLSSQANLAGYRSVLDACEIYGRAFPMMMTAAGTVPAARVFVMGAGVAGLQAIATARRLGAVVTATDVRPAAKEQVASLGAKFVAVEDDEFRQAETATGYAKPMSAEYQAKQAALVAEHIAKQDIVITTALIPGRPAPKLVSKSMVESMRMGSIVVDLAIERGGNCELSVADTITDHKGVKLIAWSNTPGRLAPTASALYARNLYAFLETMIDKAAGKLAVNWDDELVKATCLTKDGALVHPIFAPKA